MKYDDPDPWLNLIKVSKYLEYQLFTHLREGGETMVKMAMENWPF